MFQSPKTTSYVAPEEPIDVNQRYLVRCISLEDMGISKFADPNDPNAAHRIRWVFRLGKLDGTPVLDVDGNPYEHYDYTSNKTSKGKKTAQARLWMEALLGPLEDDEVDAGIVDRVRDKVAACLFEELPAQDDGGGENTARIRILRLAPYKKGTTTPAATTAPVAPARREAPMRQAAAIASRATADDADDVPF